MNETDIKQVRNSFRQVHADALTYVKANSTIGDDTESPFSLNLFTTPPEIILNLLVKNVSREDPLTPVELQVNFSSPQFPKIAD